MPATIVHDAPCRAQHGPRYCHAVELRRAIRRLRPGAVAQERRTGAPHRVFRVAWRVNTLDRRTRRLRRRIRWLRTLPTRLARPAHYTAWLCVHAGEGAWNSNTGNGYFGGLQFDDQFQRTYGADFYRRYGTADHWPPLDQMIAAERAWRSRGFAPWPQTARACGLL